jgi:hypothetical protein
MYLFDKPRYKQVLKMARQATRNTEGAEICGLIVDTGYQLSFVPTCSLILEASSCRGAMCVGLRPPQRPWVRRSLALITRILLGLPHLARQISNTHRMTHSCSFSTAPQKMDACGRSRAAERANYLLLSPRQAMTMAKHLSASLSSP